MNVRLGSQNILGPSWIVRPFRASEIYVLGLWTIRSFLNVQSIATRDTKSARKIGSTLGDDS